MKSEIMKILLVFVAVAALAMSGCDKATETADATGDTVEGAPCCPEGATCEEGECSEGAKLLTPTAIVLPEKYNSPDGLTIGPDGAIYLSMPNFGDPTHPAMILKIDADDNITEVVELPKHPELDISGPLGLAFATDGNIYVADNMSFSDDANKSRLLRVNMADGKATGVDVVAEGFIMSNAVAARGDHVYVTETMLDKSVDPLPSGVYRFTLAELAAGAPVKVTGVGDPHVIVTLETKNKDHAVGANGMNFDSKGNLFVCNFGDAELYKVTFDDKGEVSSTEVFASGSGMMCCDGVFIDKKDRMFIADFLGNAVHKVCPKSGKVATLAKNEQSDGTGGLLDAPSECAVRDGKLYVSNIDLTYGDNVYDEVHTMSVFELPPCPKKAAAACENEGSACEAEGSACEGSATAAE